MSVAFAPTAPDGAESGSLTLPYNGGPTTATLSGNALAATLTAPKSATLGGAKPLAKGAPRTIVIVNHSGASVTLGASPTLSTEFAVGAVDTCANATLAPGKSCKVAVQSAPDGTTTKGQVLTGTLDYGFSYGSNTGNPVMVALTSKVL